MNTVGHVNGPFSGTVVQSPESGVMGSTNAMSYISTLLVFTITSAGAVSPSSVMVTFSCAGRIMVHANSGPMTSDCDRTMDSSTMRATLRVLFHRKRFWKSASVLTDRYTGAPALQGPLPALSGGRGGGQGGGGGGGGGKKGVGRKGTTG